ncbi:hypothetical protein [Stieleria tagensis]|uniref:hypothetical protein n=1 Tax=Stieleria tagensis TaxID=2956795 RepID=UPI00209A697B|nr:hypothetical protein [Stieleria tagensis]
MTSISHSSAGELLDRGMAWQSAQNVSTSGRTRSISAIWLTDNWSGDSEPGCVVVVGCGSGVSLRGRQPETAATTKLMMQIIDRIDIVR